MAFLASLTPELLLDRIYNWGDRFIIKPYARYDVREAPDNTSVNALSFNASASSLTVSTDGRTVVHDLSDLATAVKLQGLCCKELPLLSEVILIQRMLESSVYCFVEAKDPTKVQVFNIDPSDQGCLASLASLAHFSPVTNICVNARRLVVCTEQRVFIYDVGNDFKLIYTFLYDLPIMDLSPSSFPDLLATASRTHNGCLVVMDLTTCPVVTSENKTTNCISNWQILAHENPVAVIRFNSDGSRLASASARGTTIRVHSSLDGTRLFEFARGCSPLQISSLAFSTDGRFLCSSSNTETVHIFSLKKIEQPQAATETGPSSWVSYIGQQATSMIPDQVNQYMHRAGSMAMCRLPFYGLKTTVAMQRVGDKNYAVVACTNGFLFCYLLPDEEGESDLVHAFCVKPQDEQRSTEDSNLQIRS